jgi:hypothetical protein
MGGIYSWGGVSESVSISGRGAMSYMMDFTPLETCSNMLLRQLEGPV